MSYARPTNASEHHYILKVVPVPFCSVMKKLHDQSIFIVSRSMIAS